MSFLGLKNPIIVALDIDDPKKALEMASQLGPLVGAIKLGPRLVLRSGPEFVQSIAKSAPVFLDFKFLDIPSTMEAAVHAAFDMGASLVTVHAWSGGIALQRLRALERDLQKIRPFQILCVTILTSFDQATLPQPLNRFDIQSQVSELAKSVSTAGLKGFVCSPFEADLIRKIEPEAFVVTPGIRLPTDPVMDQKRVCTPKEAMQKGASALVIGRPILAANNPKETITNILSEISNA